jgi:hypothetical protein
MKTMILTLIVILIAAAIVACAIRWTPDQPMHSLPTLTSAEREEVLQAAYVPDPAAQPVDVCVLRTERGPVHLHGGPGESFEIITLILGGQVELGGLSADGWRTAWVDQNTGGWIQMSDCIGMVMK